MPVFLKISHFLWLSYSISSILSSTPEILSFLSSVLYLPLRFLFEILKFSFPVGIFFSDLTSISILQLLSLF